MQPIANTPATTPSAVVARRIVPLPNMAVAPRIAGDSRIISNNTARTAKAAPSEAKPAHALLNGKTADVLAYGAAAAVSLPIIFPFIAGGFATIVLPIAIVIAGMCAAGAMVGAGAWTAMAAVADKRGIKATAARSLPMASALGFTAAAGATAMFFGFSGALPAVLFSVAAAGFGVLTARSVLAR